MYKVIMATVALMLAVAACGGDGGSGSGVDPAPTETASGEVPGDAATDAVDRVDEAVAGFAAYADVDPGKIEVVVDEQVTWRDGSLGCPDPDTAYTQELVEGYRVVLRVNGEEASYHGKEGLAPFHCEDPDSNGTVDDGPEESGTTDGPDTGESG